MQGAFKIAVAVAVAAGLLYAVPSSAQEPRALGLPQLPSVTVPQVSVPSTQVQLPAPLPPVQTPELTVPEVKVQVPEVKVQVPEVEVQVPEVRVEAPRLPAAPQVRSPAGAPQPSAPGAVAPQPADPAPASAGGTPGAATSTPPAASGARPSGSVAGATAPPSSPARPAAARAQMLRGGRGLLGTSYRSPRRLVRALHTCVAALPARQERLVELRYGVGGIAARADRTVAGALGLSSSEYSLTHRRALRGLVLDARAGGCGGSAEGATTAPGGGGGGGAGPRGAAGVGAAVGGSPSAEARQAHGVTPTRASETGASSSAEESGGLRTPLALAIEGPAGSLLAALLLAGGLAGLAVFALRGLGRR